MTIENIVSMLDQTELPVVYHHFPENKAPALPWITYSFPSSDNFNADSITYARIETLRINLYSENKDFDNEDVIVNLLQTNNIPFTRYEDYIESEKMYEVTFDTEVLING